MSFFETLGLESQVVSDESANIDGGAFPLINGGTNSIGLIHESKWSHFEGADSVIQFTFKLTDTSFKDCYARCKIKINNADIKTRQKAANLFSRFYALCGLQPPAAMPTDIDLAQFNGKMLGIEVNYWLMQDKQTGVWADGNWVGCIFDCQNFVSSDGKEQPKDLAALNAQAVPTQAAPQAQQQAQQQPAAQQQQAQQQPAYQVPAPQQQAPMASQVSWGN